MIHISSLCVLFWTSYLFYIKMWKIYKWFISIISAFLKMFGRLKTNFLNFYRFWVSFLFAYVTFSVWKQCCSKRASLILRLEMPFLYQKCAFSSSLCRIWFDFTMTINAIVFLNFPHTNKQITECHKKHIIPPI